MRIFAINKPEENNINFNGVTKVLKKRIYTDGQKDIEKILETKAKTNPVVGQLPAYIFNKIDPKNRRAVILDILKTFDDVTNILRDYLPDMTEAFIFDEDRRNCPQEVNDMLTNVFQKHKIIGKFDEIELRWLGKGGRGKAYKIVGLYDRENEDEYVLKVFHQIKGKDWHPYKSHGCYAELNSAMYWRNVEGLDTHRGKFFFGSLASGYMVTKYLDEDTRLPNRIVDEYKYGIKCTDEKKYKSKTSYEQDYNYVKDYNFDYGGMRIVNHIKNSSKIARITLEKIKKMNQKERVEYWQSRFKDKNNTDGKKAGLALGIKYLDNKNFYIDKCLEMDNPVICRALAYVLKYLPYEDAIKYFEILMNNKHRRGSEEYIDNITQVILLNEIPLLAKHKAGSMEMQDDINAVLGEIIPERIYDYYMIAEKYATPETVEHLASFVHLLPANKVKQQYRKLTNIRNEALQERLLWKFNFLTPEMREYAALRLAETISDPGLQENLLDKFRYKETDPLYQELLSRIEANKQK